MRISELLDYIENTPDLTIDHLWNRLNANKLEFNISDINPDRLQRIFVDDFDKHRIYKNKNFEVFLICWKRGYSSPIHNHPENGCILYNFIGSLCETIYEKEKTPDTIPSKILRRTMILPYQKSFINNKTGVHKIEAFDNSISLHIYSPPDAEIIKW